MVSGKGVGLMGAKCNRCKFYVTITGQPRVWKMCVAVVNAYYTGAKPLKETVDVREVMLLLGKERLETMLGQGGVDQMACNEFVGRLKK